ncbi:MAG: class I mannose-6-phosphate isomerase [Clostridia bacterium]|nr:class I mannose-6-phosphate isomerase [Clostridia bacterium]
MQHLYPLKLSYVTKSPLWGGKRLLDGWNISAPAGQDTIGEAWMLTVREKYMSVIQNGTLQGMTMRQYIDTYGNGVVGESFNGGDFPLLIKLIDACDKLSVQVHPDDDYAARVENDRGKTEMWVIVEAADDAEIIYGLRDGMSARQFRTAVREGRLSETMHHCPVKAGEVYFIPSGMLHAIGKGILIAEIQQNCDLTYRVYDYERRGADGSLRELHVDKALDVTVPFTEAEVDTIRYEAADASAIDRNTLLAHCRYFKTRKLTVSEDAKVMLTVDASSFVFLLCIDGEGALLCGDTTTSILRGEGVYLPAGLGEVTLRGKMTVLAASIQ